jgi:hypothetical protein
VAPEDPVLRTPEELRAEWTEVRARAEARETTDGIVPVCEAGCVVSWSKVVYCGLAIAEESGRTIYYLRKGVWLGDQRCLGAGISE